ncbi:MAG: hypothetical protein JWQ84_1758 [Mucilaginibacter sp.]|nr:hypothetical protein [Mucilaginibacter sp.]
MKKLWFLFFFLGLIISCKKPYLPPVIAAPGSFLVVEGVINNGSDSTIIKLSKTVNLSSTTTTNPILKAIVTVEDNQNNAYALTETAHGKYVSAGLNLNNTLQYRLRIKTADNKEYLSDYVTVLDSPPIDTINYDIQSNGINLYSGTHDPSNKVKYFRFDYTETWIFHSKYFSQFKSNGDTVLGRDLVNDNIYQCWQNDTSSTIVLASSAKLSQNVLVNNPITSVSSTSEKLEAKYSIMVRQYALSADAYIFWSNIKKNTEQLGSIFDAQPSQLNGNIHCLTNPQEAVIGYLSVGSVSSKRIFIDNRILPAWVPNTPYNMCIDTPLFYKYSEGIQKTIVNQIDLFINYNKPGPHFDVLIPIDGIFVPGAGTPIGFTAAEPACVDCTIRGSNKQPAFWK